MIAAYRQTHSSSVLTWSVGRHLLGASSDELSFSQLLRHHSSTLTFTFTFTQDSMLSSTETIISFGRDNGKGIV